jgi:hypothetical protein
MARLGPYKLKNIEAALDVEDAALSKLHQVVSKQLIRLQMEERMMQVLMKRLTEGQEGADHHETPAERELSHSPSHSSGSSEEEDESSQDSFIDDPLVGVETMSDSEIIETSS